MNKSHELEIKEMQDAGELPLGLFGTFMYQCTPSLVMYSTRLQPFVPTIGGLALKPEITQTFIEE